MSQVKNLRILAVLLVVVLVVVSFAAVYELTQLQDTITSRDATITSLHSQIQQLNTEIANDQGYFRLQVTQTLLDHQSISEPAGQSWQWNYQVPNWQGYLTVRVDSSTTTNGTLSFTYFWGDQAIRQSFGLVKSGQSYVFPVLNNCTVLIEVGNSDSTGQTQVISISFTA